jgi:hypothetical protein
MFAPCVEVIESAIQLEISEYNDLLATIESLQSRNQVLEETNRRLLRDLNDSIQSRTEAARQRRRDRLN